MKIAAVVVTYNRKKLLIECVEALKEQDLPPSCIYIVDNNSTDGTEKLLFQVGLIDQIPPDDNLKPTAVESEITNSTGKEILIRYLRLPKNVGGAGGFHEGIKAAYVGGFDWIWLMDDDTIPEKGALRALIRKVYELNMPQIGFLCSRVLDENKNVHKMNVPGIDLLINGIPFNEFEEKGVLLIKSCSFVSVLVNRNIVKSVGLPLKEFFIWVDDVEYTTRIVRNGYVGIYVRDSIVIHKSKYSSSHDVADWRFYYFVRNWLWFSKIHEKKVKYAIKLIKALLKTFRLPKKLWLKNIAACFESFLKTPRVIYPDEPKVGGSKRV